MGSIYSGRRPASPGVALPPLSGCVPHERKPHRHEIHPQRILQACRPEPCCPPRAGRQAHRDNHEEDRLRCHRSRPHRRPLSPAVGGSANSQITGLVSGHRDKADKIAAEYGVPSSSIYNYDNFDDIVHNPAVDAVYVALPNSMHAEYTIRAAKAGKHVLCEKPMSTSVADAEA